MVWFWTLLTIVPLAAFAGGVVFAPGRTLALLRRLDGSDRAALLLTAVAWLWTAYECDTIGIDVFDMVLLREPTGGIFVWALAALLTWLTFIWMRPHLVCRALMGLFMLLPAEAFKATRPLLPNYGSFGWVQIVVAVLYLYAVIGMYGMFYPWRVERAVGWLLRRRG